MKVVNYTPNELRALPILERLLIREGQRLNGTSVETPEAHKPGYYNPARAEIDRNRVEHRRHQVLTFLSKQSEPVPLNDIAADMCASPSTAKVYCFDLLSEGKISRTKDHRTGKFLWYIIGEGNDTR